MKEWLVRFAGTSLTISLLFVLNVVTFAQASRDSVWQQIDDTELSRRPFSAYPHAGLVRHIQIGQGQDEEPLGDGTCGI